MVEVRGSPMLKNKFCFHAAFWHDEAVLEMVDEELHSPCVDDDGGLESKESVYHCCAIDVDKEEILGDELREDMDYSDDVLGDVVESLEDDCSVVLPCIHVHPCHAHWKI